MIEIGISAIESQSFTVNLENISCTFKIHQRSSGLYMDLYANDNMVFSGVLCLNSTKLVRYDYLRAETGFLGDLYFIDTLGTNAPEYSELGARYKLYYMTSSEL